MDFWIAFLLWLLLSYFVMGLVHILKPSSLETLKPNEKVWIWLLSPPIMTAAIILFPIYGVVWMCGGDE